MKTSFLALALALTAAPASAFCAKPFSDDDFSRNMYQDCVRREHESELDWMHQQQQRLERELQMQRQDRRF